MTTLTPEQWQARSEALRRVAQAFGEAAAEVSRKLYECIARAAVAIRRVAVAWSVMYVRRWAPQASRERLTRHLSQAADPCGRAQYMVSQVQLGQTAPMLR